MGRNCYSEINLHINWHCSDNSPMLTSQVETLTVFDRLERIDELETVIEGRNLANEVDRKNGKEDSSSRSA